MRTNVATTQSFAPTTPTGTNPFRHCSRHHRLRHLPSHACTENRCPLNLSATCNGWGAYHRLCYRAAPHFLKISQSSTCQLAHGNMFPSTHTHTHTHRQITDTLKKANEHTLTHTLTRSHTNTHTHMHMHTQECTLFRQHLPTASLTKLQSGAP